MKLLKKLAVITAAALCANGMIPAAAADDAVMTFRMAAETDTVTTDQLADGDVTVHGGVYIDNYTGLTSMRMMLKSDAPVVIENGGFTVDPEKTDASGQPMHLLFSEHADATYTQHSDFTGEDNIILWYAKNYTKDAIANINDPASSFVDFDVRIPQDTPPGDYSIYISTAIQYNAAGLMEEDFFAYCRGDQLVLDENIILEPFTIHVLDPADTTEPVVTTTEPEITTTEPETTAAMSTTAASAL
ncbi:MAG: hypothetical protein J5753_07580, partial [Oscillospiraceae bacterium]|nr:hypothetical protein [Oscillospiraceae bacterium]